MNRTDAAAILNVDPSASPEETRRAYQELFTEHQVRLTNAPTPALRSLYQARLLELDEARDALLAPSLGDANSDLPTDQPSIPSGAAPPRQQPPPPPPPAPRSETRKPPAPPPPPPRREPPPPPKSTTAAREEAREEIRTGAKPAPKSKTGLIAAGIVVAILAVGGFVMLRKGGSDNSGSNGFNAITDSTIHGGKVSSADVAKLLADSLPALRENITVGRVEFGRGDYDAANKALMDADNHYRALPAAATSDTAVVTLKQQLDQLRSKVKLACNALKKVAERHPGEPTCKTL